MKEPLIAVTNGGIGLVIREYVATGMMVFLKVVDRQVVTGDVSGGCRRECLRMIPRVLQFTRLKSERRQYFV